MSHKFKLLILDIDGTTVSPSGTSLPSKRVIQAVNNAKQHVQIAIATGRPFELVKHVIDELDLNGLGIVSAGTKIVDMKTGNQVYAKKLDKEVLREVVAICLPFDCRMYINTLDLDNPITSIDEINEDSIHVYFNAVETRIAMQILEELESVKGIAAYPVKSWTKGDVVDMHVTHEHATKRYSAEKLIDMLGFTKSDVIAVGDDHNDVPLMQAAGFKVAMGDAPRQVKQLADYVTETLENDGLALAIEALILS